MRVHEVGVATATCLFRTSALNSIVRFHRNVREYFPMRAHSTLKNHPLLPNADRYNNPIKPIK